METIDKNGVVIVSSEKTVSWDYFIKNVINRFSTVRVGVGGGQAPFEFVYMRVKKEELIEIVRMNKMEVTYSIMFNSRVQLYLKDSLYVHKLKMTLLDEKTI